jgi:hypothetical protein
MENIRSKMEKKIYFILMVEPVADGPLALSVSSFKWRCRGSPFAPSARRRGDVAVQRAPRQCPLVLAEDWRMGAQLLADARSRRW